jgi:hypothetical protein
MTTQVCQIGFSLNDDAWYFIPISYSFASESTTSLLDDAVTYINISNLKLIVIPGLEVPVTNIILQLRQRFE